MTKHTQKAGKLPNGSIDFSKVHAAARNGKDKIFDKAVTKQRGVPERDAGESEEKTADVLPGAAPAAEADER